MNAAEEFATTADWYRRFAEIEAPGRSALFEEWAHGVAEDASILELLAELPRPKRQPNLLFACSRLVGCPLVAYAQWREWLLDHWADVRAQMLVRAHADQRAAPVRGAAAAARAGRRADRAARGRGIRRSLPLPRPLQLLVRRSPARSADGPSTVLLECATTGNPPIPTALPEIVWRAGLDLNPLDLGDAGDTLWLETLVWPEQHERRARIRAAMRDRASRPAADRAWRRHRRPARAGRPGALGGVARHRRPRPRSST